MQRVFNIADNRVYPFEFRHLNALRTTSGDYGNMLMASLLKSYEAFKAIGHHISLRREMLFSPSFDRFFGKCAHLAEMNRERTTLVTCGYYCDERDFPGSASPSLAIMLFASPVGIVYLDIFSIEILLSSRFFITCCILCLINRAVL